MLVSWSDEKLVWKIGMRSWYEKLVWEKNFLYEIKVYSTVRKRGKSDGPDKKLVWEFGMRSSYEKLAWEVGMENLVWELVWRARMRSWYEIFFCMKLRFTHQAQMKIENWGRSDGLDEVACLQKVGPLLTTFRHKMTWLDPSFLFIQNRNLQLMQRRSSEFSYHYSSKLAWTLVSMN